MSWSFYSSSDNYLGKGGSNVIRIVNLLEPYDVQQSLEQLIKNKIHLERTIQAVFLNNDSETGLKFAYIIFSLNSDAMHAKRCLDGFYGFQIDFIGPDISYKKYSAHTFPDHIVGVGHNTSYTEKLSNTYASNGMKGPYCLPRNTSPTIQKSPKELTLGGWKLEKSSTLCGNTYTEKLSNTYASNEMKGPYCLPRNTSPTIQKSPKELTLCNWKLEKSSTLCGNTSTFNAASVQKPHPTIMPSKYVSPASRKIEKFNDTSSVQTPSKYVSSASSKIEKSNNASSVRTPPYTITPSKYVSSATSKIEKSNNTSTNTSLAQAPPYKIGNRTPTTYTSSASNKIEKANSTTNASNAQGLPYTITPSKNLSSSYEPKSFSGTSLNRVSGESTRHTITPSKNLSSSYEPKPLSGASLNRVSGESTRHTINKIGYSSHVPYVQISEVKKKSTKNGCSIM